MEQVRAEAGGATCAPRPRKTTSRGYLRQPVANYARDRIIRGEACRLGGRYTGGRVRGRSRLSRKPLPRKRSSPGS